LTNTIKAYRKSELNVKEAAVFLGVSPKTIHNYISLGHLKGYKRGKFRYFMIGELEDYKNEVKKT